MFTYDKFYDVLFENDKFLSVLDNFHSSNWKKLNEDERFKVINEFIDVYCEIFGINKVQTKKEKSKRYCGSYQDFRLEVNVNKDSIMNESQYDVMDTLFHELRHYFQKRAISKNLTSIETVDEEKRKEWKLNFLQSPRGYNNYISASGDYAEYYFCQPVEEDAFKTGLALTKKAYSVLKDKFGEDVEFKAYGLKNMIQIMQYFSNEPTIVDWYLKGRNKVLEIFQENNKQIEIEKKCLLVAEKIMEKEIHDMSLEEICALFSVYVWAYLDDDYKIELLKEYDSRVNKFNPVNIEKMNNSLFKVAGVPSERNSILNILNNLFSYEYKVMVKAIVQGKIECDERLKEALTLNIYKVGGKKINFVEDTDNFLLYSIQPFALYEGKVIKRQYEEVKEAQEKFYGVVDNEYDSSMDFYDNDKYIPYIEKFYGKSFEEIYNDLIRQMRENIVKKTSKKM